MNDIDRLPPSTIQFIARAIAAQRPVDATLIARYQEQTGLVVQSQGVQPTTVVVPFANASTISASTEPGRQSAQRVPRSLAEPAPMRGFVKFQRGPTTEALIADHSAFCLLALIATRARWNNTPNSKGLLQGQAFVGDHAIIGLTRSQYRSAAERLEKWGLATFKGERRGTVATLCDDRVFVLNDTRTVQKDDQHHDHQHDHQHDHINGHPDDHPATREISHSTATVTASTVAKDSPEIRKITPTNEDRERLSEDNKTLVASAAADANSAPTRRKKPKPTQTDEEWLTELCADAAFTGLDVRREHAKMIRWCKTNNRQPTRRCFNGWLNRAERPMTGSAASVQGANTHQMPALSDAEHAKGFFHGTEFQP